MRPLKRFARESSGVVTIEFALLLPMLVLILFGSLECARFLFATTMIERYGEEIAFSVRTANGRVSLSSLASEKAADRLFPMVSEGEVTVSATYGRSLALLMSEPAEGTGTDGDTVRLEVKARVGLLSWLLPQALTGERTFVYYFVNEANSYSAL